MIGTTDLIDEKLAKMQKTVSIAFEWISYFIQTTEAIMPLVAVYADCDVLSMNDTSFVGFIRNTLSKLGLNDHSDKVRGYVIMYVDDERARMLVWNGYIAIGGTAAYYCEYDFVDGVESCYALKNRVWFKVLPEDPAHAFEVLFSFIWKSFYDLQRMECMRKIVRDRLRRLDYTWWHYV